MGTDTLLLAGDATPTAVRSQSTDMGTGTLFPLTGLYQVLFLWPAWLTARIRRRRSRVSAGQETLVPAMPGCGIRGIRRCVLSSGAGIDQKTDRPGFGARPHLRKQRSRTFFNPLRQRPALPEIFNRCGAADLRHLLHTRTNR